jgi:hypothetical protein
VALLEVRRRGEERWREEEPSKIGGRAERN